MIYEIISHSSVNEIKHFCQTCKFYRHIYNNEMFWYFLLKKHFGDLKHNKPKNRNIWYKYRYLRLAIGQAKICNISNEMIKTCLYDKAAYNSFINRVFGIRMDKSLEDFMDKLHLGRYCIKSDKNIDPVFDKLIGNILSKNCGHLHYTPKNLKMSEPR